MKLAFIGGSGHAYLRGLLNDPACNVDRPVAVAGDGHDDAAARRLCDSLNGQWFDSAERMLEDAKPDVVNVGAVYGYNGDCIAACLRRGIATVSDKPIAATWEQLDRLRQLAKTTRLITEFNFRSDRAFRSARDAVRQGLIGDIALATAQKSYRFGESRPTWYGDRRSYGSTILWVASHGIDAIRFVTDQRYTQVTGRAKNITKPQYRDLEDHTSNLFTLERGGTAIVHADFLRAAKSATHGDDRLRLVGSLGQLEVREGRCKLTTHTEPEVDITDRAAVRPIHQELLDAAMGKDESIYSTAASMELAAVLLHARDAADGQSWVEIR